MTAGPPPSRRGFALAVACVLAPAALYLGVFTFLAGRLGPTDADPLPPVAGFAAAPARVVADLAAREAFLLASAAMLVVTAAALACALGALHRAHGARGLAFGALAALVVGGLTAADGENPWRNHLVDDTFAAAAEAGALFAPGRTLAALDDIVALNTFVGIGAVAALILRFAALAAGAGDGPADPGARLAARERAAASTLVVGALVLTAAAVTTRLFYLAPAALLEGEAAETHRALAGLAATRWGAVYTGVLVTAAGPALAAIHLDVKDAVAEGRVAADEGGALLGAGFFGGPARTLGAAAAALGPAAIGPLLTGLDALLGATTAAGG